MQNNRSCAMLLARDNLSNQPETILILIPISLSETDKLNAFIANFCLRRNLALVIPADLSAWSDRVGAGEFQCEVCNQAYLRQSINIDGSLVTDEKFCSNFCRISIDTLGE